MKTLGRTVSLALMAVLLAALCLQAFVKSKELSARSEARDRALLEAQNAAEALKSGDGVYFYTMSAVVDSSGGYWIDYSEDWEPIYCSECSVGETPPAAYYLITSYKDCGLDALWTAEVSVYTERGDLLVSLPVAGQNEGEAR